MRKSQKIISFLLALVMVIGMVPPMAVHAEEMESTIETVAVETVEEETVAETTAATEETTPPTEAMTEHVEETTAPTVETIPAETVVEEIVSSDAMDAMEEIVYASGACGDQASWVLNVGGTLTISGTGEMANYATSGSNMAPWYSYHTKVIHIIIEAGITSVGDAAFFDCGGLRTVSLPDGIASIGNYSFWKCDDLTDVKFPDTLVTIGKDAFRTSGLINISVPTGVEFIGEHAFLGCYQLESVSIPASVIGIGECAFNSCNKLKAINVDSDNPRYSSLDGVLFDEGGYALQCCPGGKQGAYTIPDEVGVIRYLAFEDVNKITSITIPQSVSTIENNAVYSCDALAEIVFKGNAPAIVNVTGTLTPCVFNDADATVYYPENNRTWTDTVKRNYSVYANLTWVPYNSGEGPEDESACRLDELTDVDYMAFSAIAYKSFSGQAGKTIEEALTKKGVWGTWFSEEEGITYADLCRHIAQWKVLDLRNDSDYSGFYAVAFVNDNEEVVIAYRGSTDISKVLSKDGWQDWIKNDIPTEVFNIVLENNQYDLGFEFFETIRESGYNTSSIAVTGHSLGGGLADIVSARYGCKGVSMNAICILDAIYDYIPMEMGENFDGVDKWNFIDHASEEDIFAGKWEEKFGTRIKPYIAHRTIDNGIAHSMKTFAEKDSEGNVKLTNEMGRFTLSRPISKLQNPAQSLDLGTSADDIINKGFSVATNRTSFGGAGYDDIYTSVYDDLLIGGRGNDMLDGGRGNDRYVYYKGDGYDQIMDVSGTDKIFLRNFSYDDEIEARSYDDSDYINILCNGETIISIYKKNRDYRWNATDTFLVNVEPSNWKINITELFSKKAHDSYVEIYCPVNVEILDSDGNVVYTLLDGEVGAYYTDYGNFYVFEEENGGYGKTLDLIEGYTARIVGHDDGTMKINYREVVDGELAEPKNFVDVPVSAQFSATFEETEDGELVLAADTDGDNIVDAKIGYDGKLIPTDMVKIDQEYVALQIGETAQLCAKVQPAELTELVQWSMEDNDETVASVDENGLVTAKTVGTTYVIASVTDGKTEFTARCRVDVVEPEVEEQEKPIIRLNGVQLGTTKLTTELFSTDYAQFELLLELPQNDSAVFAMRRAVPAHNGVAIERAEFADAAAADAFELIPLDDRRIAVVPTEYALEYPKELKKSYKSAVTVWVDGEDYTTDEILTLTVKQSKPKLKAKIDTFNSFYTNQTQEITITGGTATGITVKSLPNWLTPNEDFTLSLNENAGTKNSGKAVLLVETEEWNISAEVTLSVKNAYKAPGLKLNTSTVKIAESAANAGIDLQLQPKSKKDTLKSLDVADVLPPEGYKVEGFNSLTGSFTLKAANGFQSGKITLQVKIDGTTVTVPLTLKVEIVKKNISVSFKASGNLDLSLPNHTVTVKPTFKNYSGSFTFAETETEQFTLKQDGNTISVQCKDGTETGTYKLTLKLVLDDDITVENTVKITVKRTAIKLKLSSSKLSLNKSISDMASVTVTCTTKGYDLKDPIVNVMDKSGKNLSNGLDAAYSNGKLTVSVNEDTEPGATYKVQVRAYEGAPVAALTVTILKENKSAITASLKAKGSIDVIRDGTAITLTPSYKNTGNLTEKVEKLEFFKTVKKETISADGLFAYTRNTDGTYTITKAEGAALDHSAKYSVKLVSTIGSTEVESKAISLTVKQGSAKLTLASDSNILFSRDSYSRVNFSLTAKDVQQNDISEVSIKTDKNKYNEKLEIISCGNGEFALGFANNTVDERLKGKTVTVTLNIFMKGNETAKANTTAKLKVTILK